MPLILQTRRCEKSFEKSTRAQWKVLTTVTLRLWVQVTLQVQREREKKKKKLGEVQKPIKSLVFFFFDR